MKNSIISILSILPLFAVSCLQDGITSETEIRVALSLDSFSLGRSSSGSGESEIRTVQLFVTDSDGDIVDEVYREGSSDLSFRGRVGESYHLYAFANSPSRIEGLETENDVLEWEYSTDLSGHFPAGFPMAGDREWTVSERNASVRIELTRLVSKLQLTLDKSEMDLHGIFTLTSVKLLNCPSSLKPFQVGQKALDTSDVGEGDLASEADLEKLNAGESVCFYVLENMQGDLLPSNSDPWAKTPSSLTSGEDLCTYLEATGSYSSPGYSGSDSYRMYLGSDNVKNFDLCRNSLYRLTLSPTEDNMRKDGNWKITASDWTDSRKMSFSSSSVDITPGESTTVTLSFSPSDFEFSLTESGFAAAGLSYSLSGKSITISCSDGATKGSTATLTATSWDGRVSAVCNIRVGEGVVCIKSLEVRPYSGTIKVGETMQYYGWYILEWYQDGEYVTTGEDNITTRGVTKWQVDMYPHCISVSNETPTKGLVTGLYKGETTVVCLYLDQAASAAVKVVEDSSTSSTTSGSASAQVTDKPTAYPKPK